MTGYDIYKRVLTISGYLNTSEIALCDSVLLERTIDLMNLICLDLRIPQINSLDDKIKAEPVFIDAICYGTAMLLALSQSDSEKNKLFTQIYNSKRALALSCNEKIENKLWS